jgi:hypothetical protein
VVEVQKRIIREEHAYGLDSFLTETKLRDYVKRRLVRQVVDSYKVHVNSDVLRAGWVQRHDEHTRMYRSEGLDVGTTKCIQP